MKQTTITVRPERHSRISGFLQANVLGRMGRFDARWLGHRSPPEHRIAGVHRSQGGAISAAHADERRGLSREAAALHARREAAASHLRALNEEARKAAERSESQAEEAAAWRLHGNPVAMRAAAVVFATAAETGFFVSAYEVLPVPEWIIVATALGVISAVILAIEFLGAAGARLVEGSCPRSQRIRDAVALGAGMAALVILSLGQAALRSRAVAIKVSTTGAAQGAAHMQGGLGGVFLEIQLGLLALAVISAILGQNPFGASLRVARRALRSARRSAEEARRELVEIEAKSARVEQDLLELRPRYEARQLLVAAKADAHASRQGQRALRVQIRTSGAESVDPATASEHPAHDVIELSEDPPLHAKEGQGEQDTPQEPAAALRVLALDESLSDPTGAN